MGGGCSTGGGSGVGPWSGGGSSTGGRCAEGHGAKLAHGLNITTGVPDRISGGAADLPLRVTRLSDMALRDVSRTYPSPPDRIEEAKGVQEQGALRLKREEHSRRMRDRQRSVQRLRLCFDDAPDGRA
jgi:hypothetical protein